MQKRDGFAHGGHVASKQTRVTRQTELPKTVEWKRVQIGPKMRLRKFEEAARRRTGKKEYELCWNWGANEVGGFVIWTPEKFCSSSSFPTVSLCREWSRFCRYGNFCDVMSGLWRHCCIRHRKGGKMRKPNCYSTRLVHATLFISALLYSQSSMEIVWTSRAV